MLLRVGHGKRTDFVLIFRPDGALAEEREHAACVCKRERCAARFSLFSRRSARRLVSFSSLLLSSLLSFVSFDENVNCGEVFRLKKMMMAQFLACGKIVFEKQ